jgi:excisionase family DNA binding protein
MKRVRAELGVANLLYNSENPRASVDFDLTVSIFEHMQGTDSLRERTYSTDEAAKELGLSKSTLLRWFREGRISDVKRDRNNWRVFTAADIERIRKVCDA